MTASLHFEDVGAGQDGAQAVELRGSGLGAQDFAFGIGVGISHVHAHQEAIELRLGQRIGAVMLDGILGRDDQERLRQRIGMRRRP